MKIGYITKQSPLNRKAYSGTHYYMYQALKKSFDEVIPFGPIDSNFKIIPKAKGRLIRFFSGKVYKYQYDIGLAKRMAAIIDRKITEHEPDALLASLMSPEMAYVESNVPFYLTTDATFALLNGMYESHSNLHSLSIKEAKHLEKRAYAKAKKLILPLNWLADSAMKVYGVPSHKIEVIPYGPNLDLEITEEQIDRIIEDRQRSSKIKLLFVGIRWEEKGGPFAVEVLQALAANGQEAELYITGCEPEISEQPEDVKITGFLDKEDEQDKERLHQLYKEAAFFIMPTKAECVGMSFIEAASFGLPAIGSDVGGVPEAVIHNKTGFIRTADQKPNEVANWITQVWKDPQRYRNFSKRAFMRYREEMNWNLWAEKVKEVIY